LAATFSLDSTCDFPSPASTMPRRSKRDALGAMASSLAVQRGKVSLMHRS